MIFCGFVILDWFSIIFGTTGVVLLLGTVLLLGVVLDTVLFSGEVLSANAIPQ